MSNRLAITIVSRAAGHQNFHALALEAGCHAIDIPVKRKACGQKIDTPAVAVWGWRLGQQYRNAGFEVLVLERGYIGDRFSWTSIGWNGLNGLASFPEAADANRFAKYHGHLLKPWKTGGNYVLIMGQVPGDASLGGKDLHSWYADQAARWKKRTGLRVAFRPHPLAHRRGPSRIVPGTAMIAGDLQQALNGAAVVVTWNSNSGVDAVLAGVPTMAAHPGSMAYEMCTHAPTDELILPDRLAWANTLACRQWQIDEIRSGAALRGVFAMDVGTDRRAVAHG